MKIALSLFFFLGVSFFSFSQTTDFVSLQKINLNTSKVQLFEKYVAWKHSLLVGPAFDNWKSSNTVLYTKEMWYYSESFYIKRDSFPTGVTLTEAGFDVSRFESKRNTTQEVVITFDGSKDVIVLLPTNQLIYKP